MRKFKPSPIQRPAPQAGMSNEDLSAGLTLLAQIKKTVDEEIEKVEVVNQPEVQEVVVLNPYEAPEVQKVEVLNFPPEKEEKEIVFPEVQKVQVLNQIEKLSVEVENFPSIQKVEVLDAPLPDGAATSQDQKETIKAINELKKTLDRFKFDGDALKMSSTQVLNGARGRESMKITNGSNIVDVVRLGTQVTSSDYGLVINSVIHGKTTAGGGSYVDVKVTPSGALSTEGTVTISPTTSLHAGTESTVGDSATSVTLMAQNTSRSGGCIRNGSTSRLYISRTSTASTSSPEYIDYDEIWQVPIMANGEPYRGVVTGIWASDAGGSAYIVENN